jgi:ABC-2 type transport system permease protein
MPIHDQGYRRYQGARTGRGRAWLIIASTGVRMLWRRRPFVALMLIAWLPFFARALQMYAAASLPQAAFLAATPTLFRQFLEQQEVFVFFVSIYAGAGLIANDRRANALQLYLSRPLGRVEYVLGKLTILAVCLLLVTWVPAMLLLVIQVIFAGNLTFLIANLYLAPAITAFSWLQVATVGAAMLALSSLSRSSRYVGILYAALIFFSQALFGVVRVATGDTQLAWISVTADLNQIADAIFRLPPRFNVNLWLSVAMLVALMVVSTLILERRVRAVDVVT